MDELPDERVTRASLVLFKLLPSVYILNRHEVLRGSALGSSPHPLLFRRYLWSQCTISLLAMITRLITEHARLPHLVWEAYRNGLPTLSRIVITTTRPKSANSIATASMAMSTPSHWLIPSRRSVLSYRIRV